MHRTLQMKAMCHNIPKRRTVVITRACGEWSSTNGIYQPFFELYVKAVCMKPVYGENGPPECMENVILPPMDIQMEIVDAIHLWNIVMDIEPIKGLLVRLMMMNNSEGVQVALEALSDHYEALERLQRLSDSLI